MSIYKFDRLIVVRIGLVDLLRGIFQDKISVNKDKSRTLVGSRSVSICFLHP